MAITDTDLFFLQRCQELRPQSHDPQRQVAAIIVNQGGQVLGSGTNSAPKALRMSQLDSFRAIEDDLNAKYFLLEHAERNAIFAALSSQAHLGQATMYVTNFPCADCARAIAAVGISRLVAPAPGIQGDRDEKWMEHYRFAQKILDSADVRVDYFSESLTDFSFAG
ncbi:deaminase [Ruegeria arenilitoris]|uniref:deaminase n=1 Tax=Ruegeria arenilitoris TaxID=1173585 RepID=UPI003C7E1092